ncbi:MAG: acetylserotonin O-methyltransferase [Acidobacteria bacterium]|nr:acetylserotonin O-methyltransferase [Acidobacteriota bacterium]MCI0621686.1 acetylserotonin O-methyltransferase [Acidobacteriota bacterium]MCI0724272.1 acetylserotonin O-methyltransferase [Acidobacteriota bacterium]
MQTIALADIQKQVALLQIAERLFDSVTLFALFETGVFKVLSSGPKTLQQIQEKIAGNEESLRATLDAAVALKVLSRHNERYAASELLLDCLGREDSPAYLGEWVSFLHALMGPLSQLGDAVRTGSAPGALFEDMSGDNVPAKRMTAAMDAYARSRGIEIADRLDFSQTRHLLDLGCGPGTYSIAIVQKNPQISATLLDLPGPIAEARRLAAARKVEDRLEFVAADAMCYTPSKAFDTVLVSNTLHMIGPAGSLELLRRCYHMLTSGGRVIVQAQYLNDDRVSPRWPTLLNLIQRVATPHGRNHAISETKEWMEQAGFRNVQYVRFSVWNVCSCLIGERPVNLETGGRGGSDL